MVWILTILLFWASPDAVVVQVELTSPAQCEGAAQQVAEMAARDGAMGFEIVGCDFVAQDV